MGKINTYILDRISDNPEKQKEYFLGMINNSICELTEAVDELRDIISINSLN